MGTGPRRRARAFSLIEAMIVVIIVGVLAVIAVVAYRRWVRTAYLAEAQDMVTHIRAAEEAFRAENGGYLNISNGLGPGHDYPRLTPDKNKTQWGGACVACNAGVSWSSLNIEVSAPVVFGYSLVASNSAAPSISKTVNGTALDLSAMTPPWYFIEADGDEDGNGVFTHVYAMSGNNRVFVDNEGE
ncbi:MAG TPA: prepilin-type N-terminal cleavage/methylation domain-containing protein [Polyangiaceae bacterium]|nr:prepilin-type N-terminal cleavage/methylation domain-containing protein [Polyangiaceae bacterium]